MARQITWRNVVADNEAGAAATKQAGQLFNNAFKSFTKVAEDYDTQEQQEYDTQVTANEANLQAQLDAYGNTPEEIARFQQDKAGLQSSAQAFGGNIDQAAFARKLAGKQTQQQAGVVAQDKSQQTTQNIADRPKLQLAGDNINSVTDERALDALVVPEGLTNVAEFNRMKEQRRAVIRSDKDYDASQLLKGKITKAEAISSDFQSADKTFKRRQLSFEKAVNERYGNKFSDDAGNISLPQVLTDDQIEKRADDSLTGYTFKNEESRVQLRDQTKNQLLSDRAQITKQYKPLLDLAKKYKVGARETSGERLKRVTQQLDALKLPVTERKKYSDFVKQAETDYTSVTKEGQDKIDSQKAVLKQNTDLTRTNLTRKYEADKAQLPTDATLSPEGKAIKLRDVTDFVRTNAKESDIFGGSGFTGGKGGEDVLNIVADMDRNGINITNYSSSEKGKEDNVSVPPWAIYKALSFAREEAGFLADATIDIDRFKKLVADYSSDRDLIEAHANVEALQQKYDEDLVKLNLYSLQQSAAITKGVRKGEKFRDIEGAKGTRQRYNLLNRLQQAAQ